jgi:CheY-like chemotaxis protein
MIMNRESDELINLPIPHGEKKLVEKHFDLSVLLRQDDLDMRAAVSAGPLLTVGEYCDLLQRFTGLAPDISGVIKKFAVQDFHLEKKDYKKLEQMIEILESLKCDKFAVDLYFLKNAYRKKNNWELASHHAGQIAGSFGGFYKRIEEAKQLDADRAKLYDALTLKEYIYGVDEDNINRKRIILAVDDSPDILKAVYAVLKDEYKVVPLSNPLELEDMLKHVTPDLFLLDYKMPEICGFDLIPIIRGYVEHKDTPIIFLTSFGTADRESAAVMLGACGFLAKPLKADALRETIARYI